MATINWRGKNNATAVLNWSDENGQHRVSLGKITPAEAETIKLEKELELRTGHSGVQIAPGFAEFTIEYLNWHKFEYPASHTRIDKIVEQHLRPHFKNTPLDLITLPPIELYKQQRATDGAKKETINKELRTFNAILNKAAEWEAITTNPIKKLPTLKATDSKPPRFYTKEELDKIYQFAPYNWYIWRLMANTGLRRQEVINLDWQHIQDTTITVISTEAARTKSGHWRPIPINEGAKQALDRLARDNKKRKGPLLKRITPPSLSRSFARVINRAGIEKPLGSLHSLRHTYCSHLVMQGVDLRTVQKLAGHSNISVTEKYAHLAPAHLQNSAMSINL